MTLEFSKNISAPVTNVFQAWTNPKILNKWLTVSTVGNDILLKKNGRYTLRISEDHITNGCKIINIKFNEELEFNWKGPKKFDDFLNFQMDLTTVLVRFTNLPEGTTLVSIKHYGWRSSEDYQNARLWHKEFWEKKLNCLQSIFDEK